jgi:hypothetical protein
MHDIGGWLDGIGLAKLTKLFASSGIELSHLHELTNEDLKYLGV